MKIFLVLILGVIVSQSSYATDPIHVIAVNGLAEHAVDPNMTVLQVEVWGKGLTAKAAQEIQIKFYEKVKEAAEKFKIKKEDMQTENFSINPETVYDQKTQSNRITGYRVSHTVSMIYRKVENAGTFIDALAASQKDDKGGVNIQNISWDYDKKSVIESSTLAEAVKAGRAKAEELAKAAGVKIKAVHRVQQYSSTPSVSSRVSGSMMSMKMSESAPTELSAGQIKVRVEVQMEFEI
ncbi:MAG: SIMPL domain-containing protein [Bdellovibrio sp.]|nr:SIMPL domain-containing protein [Bdellovibrio sp.]